MEFNEGVDGTRPPDKPKSLTKYLLNLGVFPGAAAGIVEMGPGTVERIKKDMGIFDEKPVAEKQEPSID